MPVHIRFEHDVLIFEGVGSYSRQSLDEAFAAALGRPEATSLVGVLLDLRQSSAMTERPASELHEMAAY